MSACIHRQSEHCGCDNGVNCPYAAESRKSAAGAQQQDDHAGSPAPSAQSSKAALSDDEIVQLARRHTVLNGSHEFCNYIAFARAILARAGIGEKNHG